MTKQSDHLPTEEDRRLSLEKQLRETKQALADSQRDCQTYLSWIAHAGRTYSSINLGVGLAHEIKQPLSAIVNDVQACLLMLQQDVLDKDAVLEGMQHVCQESYRASELIDRLRRFISRRQPRRSTLNFNHAILEMVALLQPRMTKHTIQLNLDLSDTLPLLIADRVQLEQVGFNLLNNAIESLQEQTEGKRQITLTTQVEGEDQILFSVQDTGRGIAPEHVDKVFDAFYSTRPDYMGLGLAVSRAIVEAHQGRIELVVDEKPGCRFEVRLPIQCGSALVPLEESEEQTQASDSETQISSEVN